MLADRHPAVAPTGVVITVNDFAVQTESGMMLAAALLAAGYRTLRRSPRENAARGAFCFMGVCQECLVLVDGAMQQACRMAVRAGMQVSLPAVSLPALPEAESA